MHGAILTPAIIRDFATKNLSLARTRPLKGLNARVLGEAAMVTESEDSRLQKKAGKFSLLEKTG